MLDDDLFHHHDNRTAVLVTVSVKMTVVKIHQQKYIITVTV